MKNKSKYMPHNGKQEMAMRVRQGLAGTDLHTFATKYEKKLRAEQKDNDQA